MPSYGGGFESLRLAFTPYEDPLPPEERLEGKANYATELAYIHVFLDDKEVTRRVPSGYLLWILGALLCSLPRVMAGGIGKAEWYSDPWWFELRGDPVDNRAFVTLRLTDYWFPIRNAAVPLDEFCREVIRLSYDWEAYLRQHYADEMDHPVTGEDYRYFKGCQAAAERSLSSYAKARPDR